MIAPARGYRGTGRGRSGYLQPAAEWRATTVQACGMWPFVAGSGTPMIGVPLGPSFITGATLCADPINWFQRAKLIGNPSAFVLGLPGLGKSALVKRMALGLEGQGVHPLVLGDLKPDYVALIRALGGQVIQLGRGRARLNVLDITDALKAAERMSARAGGALIAEARGRRHTLVALLITLQRGRPPQDYEDSLLGRALELLDDHDGVPVLADLAKILQAAPIELRELAFDRGDLDRYFDIVGPLLRSVTGLLGRGRLGEVFSAQTTERLRSDRPAVVDLSAIDEADQGLQAAALLASWAAGFGQISIANALADAGLEPQGRWFVIMDELWRALRGARGIVDRVDALTRLNRNVGVGQVMITHTLSDLEALPDEDDRHKARGFVERAAMLFCGGLPEAEVAKLRQVVRLSDVEAATLVGWQDPPSWDAEAGELAAPPGRGNFLVKVGGRPGIPVHVQLTTAEAQIHDTDHRWR